MKKLIIILTILICFTAVTTVVLAVANTSIEVPGISNIADKINTITTAFSSTLARVVTSITIVVCFSLGFAGYISWKRAIKISVLAILLNVVGTLVEFLYSG